MINKKLTTINERINFYAWFKKEYKEDYFECKRRGKIFNSFFDIIFGTRVMTEGKFTTKI